VVSPSPSRAEEATEPVEPTRLDSLTALRFAAALMIVVFHAWYPIMGIQGPEAGAINYGFTSVGFFFILSGFVLAWTWRPTVGIPTLWWRRFVRIFPLCALLTTGVALYYLLVPNSAPEAPTWGSFLTCFFLLQSWPQFRYLLGYNYPSWSLSTEMFFYFMFPFIALGLARVNRRAGLIALAVLAGIGYVGISAWFYKQAFYSFTPGSLLAFPPLQLLKFFLGASLGVAYRNGWRPRINLWFALGLVAVTYAVMQRLATRPGRMSAFRATELFPDIVLLIPMTLLVCAAASSDLRGRFGPGRSRILVRLGDWSFALYLVHAPILMGVNELRVRTGHLEPTRWWGMAAYLAVSIAVSGLIYQYVERPTDRTLRRVKLRRPAALSTAS
jgi:peptidoglycan/LPS O-acetylase OafA/YrhL